MHKDEKIAVYGLFSSRNQAEQAVDAMREAGFRNSDISVLFPSDLEGGQPVGHEKATKAPEGATTGSGAGLVIGGILGWLAGIGTLAIPGLGPFIAAGPIMALLAGAGVGGAVGTIAGALIGMGIPEYEAKKYEEQIRAGNILLAVHADNDEWKDKAKHILESSGAHDISSKDEAKRP